MTGCQGELVNKEFNIVITDSSGEDILNETITSPKNGFIDLWLPRNKTLKIVIEHEGKVVESEITTYKDSNTCITTMQLK